MEKTDAQDNLQAFYGMVVKDTPRPQIKWTFERDGSIKVVAKDRPENVVMWQATNPDARNFRQDKIGNAYTSTPLTPSGPNTWVAKVNAPQKGWTAFFVELSFPSGGSHPFKETTAIRVLPDTLPYAAPKPQRPATAGQLP
jgi:PhoPQ-activated pathogenicity-related protein